MHSISLELLPYFYMDVFYLMKNKEITILKCEINGIRINLTDKQTESVIDDINEILRYDFK